MPAFLASWISSSRPISSSRTAFLSSGESTAPWAFCSATNTSAKSCETATPLTFTKALLAAGPAAMTVADISAPTISTVASFESFCMFRFLQYELGGLGQYYVDQQLSCLLYTSPSPRDGLLYRM